MYGFNFKTYFSFRIHLYSEPDLVDPVIPEFQIVYFKDPESVQDESDSSRIKSENIEEIIDVSLDYFKENIFCS